MESGHLSWAKAYALIRYHYGKDPERMTEDEIIRLLGELPFIREYQVNIMEEALGRIVSRMFGEGD